MKREQKESTGIANSIEDDIVNGKAYNGYVKLCGTWVRRFWMPELETDNSNFQVLNEPTKIFDACGAIDGDESVPYGSDHEPWNNAVNFFNWYGIPEMEGFGVIIINDKNAQKYDTYNSECFNNAKTIAGTIALTAAAVFMYL